MYGKIKKTQKVSKMGQYLRTWSKIKLYTDNIKFRRSNIENRLHFISLKIKTSIS